MKQLAVVDADTDCPACGGRLFAQLVQLFPSALNVIRVAPGEIWCEDCGRSWSE